MNELFEIHFSIPVFVKQVDDSLNQGILKIAIRCKLGIVELDETFLGYVTSFDVDSYLLQLREWHKLVDWQWSWIVQIQFFEPLSQSPDLVRVKVCGHAHLKTGFIPHGEGSIRRSAKCLRGTAERLFLKKISCLFHSQK